MSRVAPVLLIVALSLLAGCGGRRPDFTTEHARALLAEHFRIAQRDIAIYSDQRGRVDGTWLVDYKVDGDPSPMQARYRAASDRWVLNALRQVVTGGPPEWELLPGEEDPTPPGPEESDGDGDVVGVSVDARSTKADLRTVAMAAESYAVDTQSYPVVADIDELARVLAPTWCKEVPVRDEWGETLYWDSDGTTYTLASSGPDREWDTADDIEMTDGEMLSP